MDDQILEYIASYTDFVGFPPIVQEIADGCGYPRSTVSYHLDKMIAWGWITKKANVPRSITIREGYLTFPTKPGIIEQISE